ncbi:MAG: phosphopyruvate hydratase [Deltaproteobacteria bacterium]|nr:phosphopyruvate hydratase [Deltaproteobacteria bacterium]
MGESRITEIRAREVLDSKGIPMVEADVIASDGSMGRATSPCGVSVGSHEAVVLRDGGERFHGLGVRKAVKNIIDTIFPALKGRDVRYQRAIDSVLNELDGTPDKSKLGANAIYSVSVAVARAASNSAGIPLYRHLGGSETYTLPIPVFNMINGGKYGGINVDFQEFLLLPTGAGSFQDALRMGVETFYHLQEVIVKRFGEHRLQIGRGAGYAAPVNEPAQVLETLLEAAEVAGYRGSVKVGLDCAATHFYDPSSHCYLFQGKSVKSRDIIKTLVELAETYPLFLIEDPLHEDDFKGHASITRRLDILIAGDDLFATQLERLKRGVSMGAGNAIVIKPNMVGTISEALETALYARDHGYCLIPGGRAGGSVDDPIPDIAIAVGASMVKFGAPRAGEKINKYNRLLQICDELGDDARWIDFKSLMQAHRK